MTNLYLVRHARPAAAWDEDPDPGLDEHGHAQARAAADNLLQSLAQPVAIYTSPLRRCRETAAALEAAWGRPAEILQEVAELPAPAFNLQARKQWLLGAVQGTWQALNEAAPPGSPDYLAWRRNMLDALIGLPGDSVVFSHFIAINAVVGAARGSDRILGFHPDYASITHLQCEGSDLRLLALGQQGETSLLAG